KRKRVAGSERARGDRPTARRELSLSGAFDALRTAPGPLGRGSGAGYKKTMKTAGAARLVHVNRLPLSGASRYGSSGHQPQARTFASDPRRGEARQLLL